MSNTTKVLVCGDVEGNFTQLFKRVGNVNQKSGPFSMLLCVGEFFGANGEEWNLYKKGKLKVPLPTYILGPCKAETKEYYTDLRGCEIVENLIHLGPHGVYPCTNGLKIAYLSGKEQQDSPKSGVTFGISAVRDLENTVGNKPQIDILITSEWPKGICNYVKGPDDLVTSNVGSLLIANLVQKLKPRYHFAGMEGSFYERLPYRNHEILKESAHHVTRFIGLAKVGNSKKHRWLYAFNATPIANLKHSELIIQPTDVTENPYPKNLRSQINKLYEHEIVSGNRKQFFYDMDSKNEDLNEKRNKRKGTDDNSSDRKKKIHQPAGLCWFCLASPEVEKHLVVSVGSYCYLALAKGGLVPDHLLILPIEHFQSTSHLEDDCRCEIEKFKTHIIQMFKKNNKTVVFFERNYKTQHLQVQVVPLPCNFAPYLKETFMDISADSGISLDEIPKHSDLSQIAPPGTPFFYVELPTGEKLFHRIRKNFPLQFGRELLACPPLLNIPERVDWRTCKMSQKEETQVRDEVREKFKEFDFTLDEDESD